MVRKEKFQMMRDDAIDRILNAATELFSSYGFAATTMQMIAKKAGVVPSGIYHYYFGKNELLDAVIERLVEKFSGVISEPLENYIHRVGLSGWIASGMEQLRQNITEIRLIGLLMLQKDSPIDVRARARELIDGMRDMIPTLFPRPEDSDAAGELLDRMLGIACAYALLNDERLLAGSTRKLLEDVERLSEKYPELRAGAQG